MKSEQKQQAIKLRKEQGLSLGEISSILNVAKSSVSLWVKDIELTKEQHDNLKRKNYLHDNQVKARKEKIRLHKNKRLSYQNNGRSKAVKNANNPLFIQGVMLYWAEGAKDKNVVDFTNSDVNMMKLFIKFLRECFDVKDEKIKLIVSCYLNEDSLSQKEIEDYWLNQLSLLRSSLGKTMINKTPKSSQRKHLNKLDYGFVKLRVCNTEIMQEIYGAIKQFANINDEDLWVF